MRFRFKQKKLRELYCKGKGREKYPEGVFKAFLRGMAVIKGAKDERDLRSLKGARFEKLATKPGVHSMRLGRQYRLEMSFEESEACEKIVCIEKLGKHYGD